MARILINNIALRNNGDVALARNLRLALLHRGHEVLLCGFPLHTADIPQLQICRDAIGYRLRPFRCPVLVDIAALLLLLFHPDYRRADALIGAPGGYLQSLYGIRWKLRLYRWAKHLGKKTAIYSQSVGPLDQADQGHLLAAEPYLDWLVVRDDASLRTAVQAGFRRDKVLLTDDAIFLSRPRSSPASPRSRLALFSVREWRHAGRDAQRFCALIHRLMDSAIAAGFEIQFVSTCQGIPGYTDDSKVAQWIVDRFPGDRRRLTICRERLSVEELERRIDHAGFIVGTRLHMCLLAMMAGIPAFNISYEAKGTECYRYMEISEHSVDYNAEPEHAAARFRGFLDRLDPLRRHIGAQVAVRHRLANERLDRFLADLGIPGTPGDFRQRPA